MYNFLNKNVTDIIDIFLVFSNQYEYELFDKKQKIKPIILSTNFNTGNIVTYKKFFALTLLMNNINYDYFIVCDAEIDIIPENFNMNNISNKVESIFKNKKIYGGEIDHNFAAKIINDQSATVFCLDDYNKLNELTNNFNLYYWWSDVPVYKREHLPDFFNKLSFDNINWSHFDHIIYLNYLLLIIVISIKWLILLIIIKNYIKIFL
jgi:hypothetical protein